MNLRSIISTIAIIVVGGIIILLIEYSFFNSKSNLPQQIESILSETSNVNKDTNSSSIESSAFVLDEEHHLTIEENVDELEIILQSARSINNHYTRDQEYSRIIEIGLSEKKPVFAFKVASHINNYYTRDNAYIQIVKHSLENKKPQVSYLAAKSISNSYTKDIECIKIIKYSLIHDNLNLAYLVAKSISNSYTRDLEYKKIIDNVFELRASRIKNDNTTKTKK